MLILRILVFLAGSLVVGGTVLSAVRTFVLPRAAQVLISRMVFQAVRRVFNLLARPSRPFAIRDRVMAMYVPISVVVLPATWYVLIILGFTAMLWAVGVRSLRDAFILSGSSLFTLGFERPELLPAAILSFIEAPLGLGLLALLISYLPSIYAAFSRRETVVSQLEPLAGSPPSPQEMLIRHQRILGMERLERVWTRWQDWFADIEESHTSIAAVVFLRSPEPDRSWVTAAGCILDTASLTESCLDRPASPEAQICIRAGYVALRRIADFFAVGYDTDPRPDDRSRSAATNSTPSGMLWPPQVSGSSPTGIGPGGSMPAGGSTMTRCSSPLRGSPWHPLRPGLRIVPFRFHRPG